MKNLERKISPRPGGSPLNAWVEPEKSCIRISAYISSKPIRFRIKCSAELIEEYNKMQNEFILHFDAILESRDEIAKSHGR